ncbi:MAG TPA: Zn-dependent hydrolase [Bacteroidales bacterium]|nr:Zn-dependent hydrolase [Bacteroidales bacterium]HNS47276.1 Zn-dependent hydrolase [Bacteroidales bacterium]
MKKLTIAGIAIAMMSLAACTTKTVMTEDQKETNHTGILPQLGAYPPASQAQVDARLAIYAPVDLQADISHLSANEKQILSILMDVARIMDDLYWQQTLGNKEAFLGKIQDPNTRDFALINYGPWDRLDNNRSFIEGIGAKPAGANFYPLDMTREEFEAFADPNKASLYTLIRRNDDGTLRCVWYHEAYAAKIQQAASLMTKAAELAENEGLKNYLTIRAKALLTDDYQASDFAWLDMKDSNLDFVVGPIENYEDALFGYKAAFESFILIKDNEWSQRLAKYAAMLPDMQKGLPVEDAYKQEKPGIDADLNAYDVIYYAGDCNSGSKTIAINLPNDEEVQLQAGSRKLQLKNAMRAKFDKIVVPIAQMIIDPEQQKYVTFDAFFSNTMFHEVSHGMGIKNTVNGKGTVRNALKEQYSALEEGKADIMGLFLMTKLYEMGEITEEALKESYITFFAGIFRSSRFGAASAHGKANMMRFNYFEEKGVFTRSEQGYFTVDFEKMKAAMTTLVQDILHVQGDGNYDLAKQWIAEKGVIMPQLQADLDRLNSSGIPVDIVFNQGKSVMEME